MDKLEKSKVFCDGNKIIICADEPGDFPLHLIDSDRAVKPAVDAIADLILHQFEDAREFLPALEFTAECG